MARIRVENSREHLKKTVALLLIRRAVAQAIYDPETGRLVAIRRLIVAEIPSAAALYRAPVVPKPSIPDKMPPLEVPGCHFKAPTPRAVLLPSALTSGRRPNDNSQEGRGASPEPTALGAEI